MLTCGNCGRESPDGFAFCPACASPLDGSSGPRGARKTVSIVFCDVTGSTALGERLDPEGLRAVMSRYFERMRAAVERHGGEIEKFIGDAVVAVFGLRELHEDDAMRAVRTAIDMRAALASLNEELTHEQGEALQVRIGLNTGSVFTSSPNAGDVLATGDAMNVAARLQQAADPGEILIGNETLGLVRDAVIVGPVVKLAAKGKTEALSAYRLLDLDEGTPGIARRSDAPIVGREGELAELRRVLDAVVGDRSCRLVTILGVPGVGKSRLTAEFSAALDPDVTVLRGHCLPYGEGLTYLPVVEIVKQAASIADEDAPAIVENKLRAVLAGTEHEDTIRRHVGQLLGIADPVSGGESFWAIRRFLITIASTRPLVILFDDIQWADPSFLDLVEHVAVWARDAPILIVCMARTDLLDRRPGWGSEQLVAATTISLDPLSDRQSAELVMHLLQGLELPDALMEQISELADGNPLFIEQVVAMMVDDGALVRNDGRWRTADDLRSIPIPPSVHALLAARIDRSSSNERSMLEAAAVVGKGFSLDVVRQLVPDTVRPSVNASALSLIRKELVRPDRHAPAGSEDAYLFSHQLVRDTAYDMIPKATRADLHVRCAAWFEGAAGDRVAEQEEVLGYHLEQAYRFRSELGGPREDTMELGRRGAMHLASAGRRAAERGDHGAASALFMRAKQLLVPDDPDLPAVLFDLGSAQVQTGELPAAMDTFDEAERSAHAIGDRSTEWRARIRHSTTRTQVDPRGSSTSEFREELEAAVRIFTDLGDEPGLATAWTEFGWLEWGPLRYTAARRALNRAVDHARRAGDRRLVAEALILLLAAHMHGDTPPEEGLRVLDETADDLKDDLRGHGIRSVIEAAFRSLNGEFDVARELFARARDLFDELGQPYLQRHVTEQLGWSEMDAGDAVAAERAFREQFKLSEAMGDRSRQSTAATNLAAALCELGRYDEAEELAALGQEMGAADDLASQVAGRIIDAKIASSRGQNELAERLALGSIEMLDDTECPGLLAATWMTLAEAQKAAGKVDGAAAAAGTALELRIRKGDVPGQARVRAFLETVYSM